MLAVEVEVDPGVSDGAVVVAVAAGGGVPSPPVDDPLPDPPLTTPVTVDAARQVQDAGQSASVRQVGSCSWQKPGNDVVVMQSGGAVTMSAGRARGEAPPAPAVGVAVPALPELPVPTPAPPEQVAVTVGLQVKIASPQSASALHGNCHRNAHMDRVIGVHVVVVVSAGGTSHLVFDGQGGVAGAVPPVQMENVSLWQTIPAPQSASAVQAAS